MNAVKTIDIKGLGHGEKEGLIFPSVEGLAANETLRIVVEFNPVPLVYMLKAQGEFEISYEKEGPDEWILNVHRIAPGEDKKEQFKELLTELKEGGASEETKKKAKALLQAVDATSLGIMEQELIREGVSHDEIRKSLCDIHLEVLRDSLVSKRQEVSAPHPINTFMEEHKIIVNSLHELSSLVERLPAITSLAAMGEDREKLKDIAHHLVESESHHQREEEVLFPELERHDIVEPPAIMKLDHVEFRKRKQELYQLAYNPQDYDFSQFKTRVIELGEYLSKELESHIFKEDNILYQIALQVLNAEEWEKIHRECDKVGYCCFTPGDQKKEEIMELDLRAMPPFERHEKIFELWDALKPGETLRITNDHDPKPLHYQFEAEYKGQYQWEYEQQGPKDWVVKIKKV
ncbi:MAG: DUF438 domain-containing protein [Chloroflexi bacterium]|nr:DUF438 domain-containing protein [Chloroflexota bacterium]MBI3930693.1 DUF438 domain-containing protein [Chloroflexota bacterium]